MKTALTDRAIKAAKADMADAVVPGLTLRVMPSGVKSFCLIARYPGSSNPTRRSLGAYGVISLQDARDKARAWLGLLARGVDPAGEVERERLDADRKRADTVAAVYAVYRREKIIGPDPKHPRQRAWRRTVHNFEDILIPLFGQRPIAELTSKEVLAALREIEELGTDHGLVKLKVRKQLRRPGTKPKPAPQQGRNLFVYLDGMLRWAARTGDYGLEVSPLTRVSKTDRFGEAPRRDRFLDETEIGSAWRASGELRAPYRQMYRMLMLTGLRLSEVRTAEWPEFDVVRAKEWTIPARKMKGKNGKAKAHTVPLTPHMLAVLKEIPRGPRGPFVFSVNEGQSPIYGRGGSKGDFKRMLDEAMAHDLRVHEVAHFTNHDLRRTLRTLGTKVGIGAVLGEKMLAHALPGLAGIYDQGDYLGERRDAHTRWGEFLLNCAGKPSKVVRLRKA